MIRSFAYAGFASPAADEWRTFGPEVLGLQLADDGPSGTVRLRLDAHAPRLTVRPGERNELLHLGWDVGDAPALIDAIAQLAEHGITAERDDQRAAERQVEGLARFTDPFGFVHELVHGLATVGGFTPGRPMQGGFVTGDQGLGHLVLFVPDLAAGLSFFMDVLGFRLSDHIDTPEGLVLRFLHCNPRHHTLALAAIPGRAGMHHLMFETEQPDDVGRALDIVNARGLPVAMTLGKHTNDWMTSFYVRTPSGFDVEYGSGGRTIDEATWTIGQYDAMSIWGHNPPTDRRLAPEILRRVG